jgi:hypothetical protein
VHLHKLLPLAEHLEWLSKDGDPLEAAAPRTRGFFLAKRYHTFNQ